MNKKMGTEMAYLDSKVEKSFQKESGIVQMSTTTPYVVTDSVQKLGLLMALRFIEWVSQNPQGVISLPTGKTPQYFIHYVHKIMEGWQTETIQRLLEKYGLGHLEKPSFQNLHFVQMDEFYPINPAQHNSFCHYVTETYVKGFGLDPKNVLLMNSDDIALADGHPFAEVFPDLYVDLSLRYRQPLNPLEEIQMRSIFLIEDWCARYEEKIREWGGIGFFLCPIGTDGRLAFNVCGSNSNSVTRLTETNYAAQADAASDLGGLSVSKKRLVLTIGLQTITANPEAVAIAYAAGEANAKMVQCSLESPVTASYPATVLQRLKNGRFFLTTGSASKLHDSYDRYFDSKNWSFEKTERAVLSLCKKLDRYAHNLTLQDLQNDIYCQRIPNLSLKVVQEVIDDVRRKLENGCRTFESERFFITGPHHDDIMLGIQPLISRQLRSATNQVHFAVMTSGFNSVTNNFLIEAMEDTLDFLRKDEIQMIHYPDFFCCGYQMKYDKDVSHYLDNAARKNPYEMRRGFCHRLLRNAVGLWKLQNADELIRRFKSEIEILKNSYDGEKNSPEIQKLKGSVREFEEELLWAYMGVPVKNIHHLRLGFYQSALFEEGPNVERDVMPILQQLRTLNPSVLAVVVDPEGIGPDTHYKVLQSVAKAVELWSREADLSQLKIWGYRNVWFTFHLAEANALVPVSLNSCAVLEQSFKTSYLTQVKAEFPSPNFDGPFSELAESIWGEQLKEVQLILGKDFFYENIKPLIRATHGLIYMKEMNVTEFLSMAQQIKKVNHTDE